MPYVEIACPACERAQRIPEEAWSRPFACRYCGERFLPQTEGVPVVAPRREERARRYDTIRRDFICPWCDRATDPLERDCLRCGHSLRGDDLRDAVARLDRQRLWCQILCFVFGLVGIGLAVAGWNLAWRDLSFSPPTRSYLLASAMVFGGYLLLWIGIGFGVAFKRRSLVDIWLGVLGVIGLIILMALHDQKARQLSRIKAIMRYRRERPAEREERRAEPPPLPAVLPLPHTEAIVEMPVSRAPSHSTDTAVQPAPPAPPAESRGDSGTSSEPIPLPSAPPARIEGQDSAPP